MELSVLDQSPVRDGGTANQALHESILLAQTCGELGYKRYWVAEHHNAHCLAGSSPEVLLGSIGATTPKIRIGSGGVMLPFYSPFKVAENFSVLSNLFPCRVDLGIGRAPGGDMKTAQMVAPGGRPQFDKFPELASQLFSMLHNPDLDPPITPKIETPPSLWMLGSSPDSAILAARLGIPYNFALFINSKIDRRILDFYRENFNPSVQSTEPRTCITLNVICAETELEAKRLSLSRDLLFARFATGQSSNVVPTIEEAEQYNFNEAEKAYLADKFRLAAVGNPTQVKNTIDQLISEFDPDEIMAVTITHDFNSRVKSYQLLSELYF
tara:strand:- start:82426 stop:83403 length:978 start_codon:yes stop_codon:yes gene_type:complete